MAISGVPPTDVFHYFLINTCISLVVCNLGMYLMRHVCGRRTLLLMGSASNAAWLLGLAVSSSVETSFKTSQTLLITFTSLFMIGYSFLTAVVTRPVATEVVSTRLRAYSFGTTLAISSVVLWLISFCTPYFINPENMHWVSSISWPHIPVIILLTISHRAENTATSLPPRTSSVSYGITSSFPRPKAARLKRLTNSSRRRWQPRISRPL